MTKHYFVREKLKVTGESVALCDSAVHNGDKKNLANGILLALAPELLEGCRKAMKVLDEETAAHNDGTEEHPLIAKHTAVAAELWALIARAEGREL
jgi:hypothetical protein